MPKELDQKERMVKTRDGLVRLVEIADREGFEEFREKIVGIAEEASRMVEELSPEQYARA
ncbi:MAG: hypothetical protein WCX77_00630 [Candidatus Paceibacterota bacterium]